MPEPSSAIPDSRSRPMPGASSPRPARRRPGLLTALAIIAIVLGAWGLLGGFVGVAVLGFGDQLQTVLNPVAERGLPGSVEEAQQDFQNEMRDFQHRYFPVSLGLILGGLFVAGLLLAGGVSTLRLAPCGRRVFLIGCWVAGVFEVIRMPVHSIIQMQGSAQMMRNMTRLVDAAGGGSSPSSVDRMLTASRVGMGVAMLGGILWGVLQLAFCGVTIWQLHRSETQSLFEKPTG
jgi:hypothetical protein